MKKKYGNHTISVDDLIGFASTIEIAAGDAWDGNRKRLLAQFALTDTNITFVVMHQANTRNFSTIAVAMAAYNDL